MLLIAVTGVVFGPVEGSLYAITGAVLSAAATYYAGRRLGRATVRRIAGARINRLSEAIARRGILAMALIRLLPIAPFTVVNVVAGASHIRARDFLLGTALGMAPGILVTTTFVHQLANAAEEPSAAAFAVLAAAALAIVLAAGWLRRHLA
jgi:phospholipase D1/2